MKLILTLIAASVYGIFLDACPRFNHPWESRPDSVRVIYQNIKVYKNAETGLIWARIAPHKYFNSMSIRFPKGMLSSAKFKAELIYEEADPEWGTLRYRYSNQNIQKDAHFEHPSSDQADLIFTGEGCYAFYLKQTEGWTPDSIEVTLILQYVPPFKGQLPKQVQSRAKCAEPVSIPQSIWRTGLPAPIKGRVASETHHCIVHHSSSGNGDTNYTDLVRSYYTYHTQVNGWDDIGYNYLVAANGDIYTGRDPEKVGIFQDNVVGAHFCAKNTNTMGVCMIGDFTTKTPSDTALASLYKLLAWKVMKDTLNAYGQNPHPSPTDAMLAVIAGHRDGCNTECPGDSLYSKLGKIRVEAARCMTFNALHHWKANTAVVITTEAGWYLSNIPVGITAELFDISGKLVFTQKSYNTNLYITSPSPGLHILRLVFDAQESEVIKLAR